MEGYENEFEFIDKVTPWFQTGRQNPLWSPTIAIYTLFTEHLICTSPLNSEEKYKMIL